jgi:uncharacterized protein DUF4360
VARFASDSHSSYLVSDKEIHGTVTADQQKMRSVVRDRKKPSMLKTIAMFSATAALVAVPFAPSASAAAPLSIEVATVNGSGCPAGDGASVSVNGDTVTLSYSGYSAQSGGTAAPTDFRRNCQINLQVSVPDGYTYTVAEANFTGYASVGRGATALQRANYYFSGEAATTALPHPINGPYRGGWATTDTTAGLAALGTAPCSADRNLNINTELRAESDNPYAASSITMDSSSFRLVATPCA